MRSQLYACLSNVLLLCAVLSVTEIANHSFFTCEDECHASETKKVEASAELLDPLYTLK